MEVLVFKTNIREKEDISKVKPALERCRDILRWNIDTGDVDKVLRIEAATNITSKVERLISWTGYSCTELE